jgi:hypothetical protein
MIDFNLFVEKIDEWAELTVLHTLQRTLKTRMYDRIRDFPEDAFKCAVESLISEGVQPSFKALKDRLQMAQKQKLGPPKEDPRQIFKESCDLGRECSICDADGCKELDDFCKIWIPRIMMPEYHEEAKRKLKEAFPQLNWFPERTKVIGMRRKADGSFEPVREVQVVGNSGSIHEDFD